MKPKSKQHTNIDGLVRMSPLLSIPSILRELGYDPEPILNEAGFSLNQFKDPETKISFLAGGKLLAHCVMVKGCQHFGFMVGERAHSSSLGLPGFMLQSAPNVGKALLTLLQHLGLHDQGGVPVLAIYGDVAVFSYVIHISGVEATDHIYDLSTAIICNIMRDLCGPDWNPERVLLSRHAPSCVKPYERFFQAPLLFGQEENAVVFSTRWLKHIPTTADPLLFKYLEKEAVNLHTQQPTNIIHNLRQLIRTSLGREKCSVTKIAEKLGIHERTLDRRLLDQGTSFRQELEDIRYEIAQKLMTETTSPLCDVAATLDYSDTSAFSRAFKRWSGSSPTQWRNAVSHSSESEHHN